MKTAALILLVWLQVAIAFAESPIYTTESTSTVVYVTEEYTIVEATRDLKAYLFETAYGSYNILNRLGRFLGLLEDTVEQISLLEDTVEQISLLEDTVEQISLLEDTVEQISLLEDTIEYIRETIEHIHEVRENKSALIQILDGFQDSLNGGMVQDSDENLLQVVDDFISRLHETRAALVETIINLGEIKAVGVETIINLDETRADLGLVRQHAVIIMKDIIDLTSFSDALRDRLSEFRDMLVNEQFDEGSETIV